jgi:hypothetical protein
MIATVVLSSCHGEAGGPYKTRWVNEADSKKVLEVTLQNPSAMGRVHMAIFGGRVKGTYLLKDGDKTTEGRVTEVADAYRLTAEDGTQQQFSVERNSGLLKDESGATWKSDNPQTTAQTLKKW